MSGPVNRNCVVFLLGTPQGTEGSLNDPVEREEPGIGIRYNEKWIYEGLKDDPAGASQRMIYWHRYDFVATMVRDGESLEWRPDSTLAEACEAGKARQSEISGRHSAYPDNGRYRQVSTLRDSGDLGGYVQEAGSGRLIGEEES
ncbi:MAG TPA: hypothetical protein VJN94_04970 [Candidatus Binataceae bacterium]|nr:hypothetical protein [Candidatus Binataceae bacterium]